MQRDDLLPLDRPALARVMEAGHPIDPAALAGWEYKGVAVGSALIEKIAWKTFRKTFHRDSESGVLRGWNYRVEQDGVDGAYPIRQKGGKDFSWGFYRVVDGKGHRMPWQADHGLVIDYGFGENGLSPQSLVKDPLLAVNADSADLLIGVSYVDLGLFTLPTPTFFILSRDQPLRSVVASAASRG